MFFVVDEHTGGFTSHNTREEAIQYIQEEYKFDDSLDGVHVIQGKELILTGTIQDPKITFTLDE